MWTGLCSYGASVFVVRLMTCQAPVCSPPTFAFRRSQSSGTCTWGPAGASDLFPFSAQSSLWGQQAALCSTRGAWAVWDSPVILDREAERGAWGR